VAEASGRIVLLPQTPEQWALLLRLHVEIFLEGRPRFGPAFVRYRAARIGSE